MNYKQACLKPVSQIIKPDYIKPNIEMDENEMFRRSCIKAVHTLHIRWTKYKEDYIALYGEDTYNKMYLTPNYWVMPEDEEEEDDDDDTHQYYSSSDER